MSVKLRNGRHLGGWRRDKPDHRDRLVVPPPAAFMPVRSRIRWEIPIFDQGALGSCAANAACSMVAHLDRQDDGIARTYSRLYLYARTRLLEGTPLVEDSGVEIRDVFKALRLNGVCEERLWPYDPACFDMLPGEEADGNAEAHQAIFYYRCPSLKLVKTSIAQAFPVQFGFSCPENLFSNEAARTGKVLYPEPGEKLDGGHAVLGTAYDDEMRIGDEVGAIGGPNSWGTSWGDRGWIWIPFRFFVEELATDAWTLRSIEL